MLKRIVRRMVSRRPRILPIPLYHLCSPVPINSVNGNIHNVKPENLRAQLLFLKRRYKILQLDELAEEFLKKGSVKNVAAATFDDGYVSVLADAAPIFSELGIPFTFFVNGKLVSERTFWRDKVRALIDSNELQGFIATAPKSWSLSPSNFYRQSKNPRINSAEFEMLIDGYFRKVSVGTAASPKYCTWEQLKQKSEHVQLGNHSYSHYVLSSLSRDAQYHEIFKNQVLMKQLGSQSRIFSIPFGNSGTYDENTLMILKDLGYKGYVLSVPFQECETMRLDRYGLIRINRFMPADTPTLPTCD